MPTDRIFTHSHANESNENDYDSMLKMMRKLNATIVTVQYANTPTQKGKREIISFGALSTIAFIFDGDNLIDMASSEMSFKEWIATEFLLSKGNDNIITIYNN